jgi:hypothetical protein
MGIALLMEKFTSLIQSNNIVVREIHPTIERTISLGRVSNKVHLIASNLFWDYFSSRTLINDFSSHKPKVLASSSTKKRK